MFSFLAGCQSLPVTVDDANEHRIWDSSQNSHIDKSTLIDRLLSADYILLGEIHDNPVHHQIQEEVLEAVVNHGGKPALVMEMLDIDEQPAIDQFIKNPGDLEAFNEATGFAKKGWDWPMYRPLINTMLDRRLPIIAANLSRTELMQVVRGSLAGLPDEIRQLVEQSGGLTVAQQELLKQDILDSHCGKLPLDMVPGMAQAQIARDAMMALRLKNSSKPAVLIAGSGHVRRDRAVPFYLAKLDPGATIAALGMIEIKSGGEAEEKQIREPLFDYVWYTSAVDRKDPCEGFAIKSN